MHREPELKNIRNNPIKQLRALLKDQAEGGRASISQTTLARLCQIPLDTIKSIESGRLRLTPDLAKRFAVATGAGWDYDRQRWTLFNGDAFSFAHFSKHRSSKLNPSPIDQALNHMMVGELQYRVAWLFDHAPAEEWGMLKFEMDHFLNRWKQKLTASDAPFPQPPWRVSATDSADTQGVKEGQQKREHASKKPVKGSYAVSGNKKRKPLYLP
jgi:hypothetical protein